MQRPLFPVLDSRRVSRCMAFMEALLSKETDSKLWLLKAKIRKRARKQLGMRLRLQRAARARATAASSRLQVRSISIFAAHR